MKDEIMMRTSSELANLECWLLSPWNCGQLVCCNESLRLLEHFCRNFTVLNQRLQQLRDGEDGVEPLAVVLDVLAAALLAIEEHNHILDDHALVLQGCYSFEDAQAARDEVLDDDTLLAALENTFDDLLGAVALDLLAAHNHGLAALRGQQSSDRERSVRNAAQQIVVESSQLIEQQDHHVVQERREGDKDAKIDVDWRSDAALQLEFAKLDGAHVEEEEGQVLKLLLGRLARHVREKGFSFPQMQSPNSRPVYLRAHTRNFS